MRNINLPKARVYVSGAAFGRDPKHCEPAYLVSVRAMRGSTFAYQVWVDAYAACYDKVPPHLLYHYPIDAELADATDYPLLPLNKVQMWECLSGSVELWRKDQLRDTPVLVNLGKGQKPMRGNYWFTVDFLPEQQHLGMLDVGDSEVLEEHKEANFIKLYNGQVAIYPNNRIKYMPPSLTTDAAVAAIPDWDAASTEKWDEWWQDSTENFGDANWSY